MEVLFHILVAELWYDLPFHALAWLVCPARNLLKVLAQREIMTDGILPATAAMSEVSVVVLDELVDLDDMDGP